MPSLVEVGKISSKQKEENSLAILEPLFRLFDLDPDPKRLKVLRPYLFRMVHSLTMHCPLIPYQANRISFDENYVHPFRTNDQWVGRTQRASMKMRPLVGGC